MAPVTYSFAARVVVISLIVLVLIQGLVALAMLSFPGRDPLQYSLPLPNQLVAIVQAVEPANHNDRARILAAVNSPMMSVELLPDFPARDAGAGASPLIEHLLGSYAHVLATHELRVDTQPIFGMVARLRADESGTLHSLGRLRMLVRLDDGSVLSFLPSRSATFAITAARIAGVAAILGIVVVIAFVIAINQTSRPVRQLANAARRFGTDFDTSELPVAGPREIRDLSIAFNEMKRTIRGLVDERTRILAAIAHDMRTYLTRLRLRVDFISDPEQNERAGRDLDEMAKLLEDTLLFARQTTNAAPGESSPEGCDDAGQAHSDVAAIIRQICSARTASGDDVSFEDVRDVGAVDLSSTTLKRLVENLIENAVRYGKHAAVMTTRYGNEIHICIEDDGPGIPPHEIDRVLRPFERLEQSRHRDSGGTGLGLAIVNAIVQKAHGRLELENRAQGGLRCTVVLPRAFRGDGVW
jgi:two-component system osmolarity sensor histidine kinase EnvZ